MYLLKIDLSQERKYAKLRQVIGVETTPSILLTVNGKGMWMSGTNVSLLID